MKKNTMMRMAALLLVAVLLTTCVISGTFAKYVTEASAQDSARVAKFGVLLSVEGDSAFANQYKTDDSSVNGVEFSVKAENTDKVVAPGTKSDKGMTFSIKGTPEVAVKVDIDFIVENDIYFEKGTYTDLTTVDSSATFTTEVDYHPVVFTLTEDDKGVIASGALDDIKTAIAAYCDDIKNVYAPNTAFDTSFTLTWEWPFDYKSSASAIESSAIDKADTLLGDLVDSAAIPSGATLPSNYSTELAYKLTIKVTQID